MSYKEWKTNFSLEHPHWENRNTSLEAKLLPKNFHWNKLEIPIFLEFPGTFCNGNPAGSSESETNLSSDLGSLLYHLIIIMQP